jgi:hypothetical protein
MSSVQMLKMLAFFATSGSSGTAGSVAVDAKTDGVVVDELRRGLVLRAEGDLRLLLGVEIDAEQLLVPADPRPL